MKYKLFKFNESYAIKRISDNVSFLIDLKNRDYFQFVEDIYEQGIGIVEGADIQTEIPYVDARVAEYPPIGDQLDKIYHSGVNAWKADIKVIKDKYPKTQVGITTTEALPSWLNEALFDKQKEKYIEAKERLEQYELSVGVVDESKNSEIDPISKTYIIEPLPIAVEKDGETIRNPLVVQDEQERMAARQVINQTPQAVIDSINT
tara:strand:- start:9 stop:623 length:615 start_codon:yes stop_codon:yes gene_type:complete